VLEVCFQGKRIPDVERGKHIVAAEDTFESFTASLPERDRESLKDFIRAKREEMLAARSEDARSRLVNDYIKEVHELLCQHHERIKSI